MIISTPIDCVVRLLTARIKIYYETGSFFKSPYSRTLSYSKTVAEFVSNYSNPPLSLDFRYAQFIVCVYVPLIFGAGLPILYPITLANLVV
jgi:hypothetical protein